MIRNEHHVEVYVDTVTEGKTSYPAWFTRCYTCPWESKAPRAYRYLADADKRLHVQTNKLLASVST